jgi:hypothetical protein
MLEVLTPGSEIYTSLAEFKAFAGIVDNSQDAYWSGQIASACIIVSEHCGRPLCSEGVRETLRLGEALNTIVLQRWPVSVTPTVTFGPDNTPVSSSLYEVDVRAGIIRGVGQAGTYVPFDAGVWKITYSGGYITIPSAVKQAVWQLAREGDALGKIKAGLKSRRIEGAVAESYFDPDKLTDELPVGVKMLLRRYAER